MIIEYILNITNPLGTAQSKSLNFYCTLFSFSYFSFKVFTSAFSLLRKGKACFSGVVPKSLACCCSS